MAQEDFKTRRTRKSTPRAKTGCMTCRIRHVKCDEGKPSCQRCVTTGRLCDGYAQPTAITSSRPPSPSYAFSTVSVNATSGRKAHHRRPPLPLSVSIASYDIPFQVPGSQRDRQLLHYFCVQAEAEMSGYLGAESGPFWSRTVLRGSHEEPAVRKALVALSSLHLGHCIDDSKPDRVPGHRGVVNEEALMQYGRALHALHKRIGTASGEVRRGQERTAMICSVLFYCFESALGDSGGAMRHLENGLQVLMALRERQQQDVTAGDSGERTELEGGGEEIAEMLARLDLQATMFDDNRVPSLTLVSDTEREAGITQLRGGAGALRPGTATFHSAQEAQFLLHRLQNWLFRFLPETFQYRGYSVEDIPSHILREKARLVDDYRRWDVMFDGLVGDSSRRRIQNGTKILRVHHRLTLLLLESTLPDDPALFGAEPNTEAIELLDTIEEVIRSRNCDDGKELARSLSSETGVIAPLFLLAVKCADEIVAARAATLLSRFRRREGLYDAETMTGVLGRLQAAREEKGGALEGLSRAEISAEPREGVGKEREARMTMSLEILASEMIDSRAGGVDAIGARTPV